MSALGLVACGGEVSGPPEVVALSIAGTAAKASSCFESRSPLELGTSPTGTFALSPGGEYLAVHLGVAGVDIVSTADASRHRLAGDGVDVTGLRWSDDGKHLAYFAAGTPRIADGDGSNPVTVDVPLPDPPADYAFQDAEWSHDGKQLGFVTRGVALLADPRTGTARVFSQEAIVHYSTPWALAFAPDGAMVGLLQADASDIRTVLVARTETLEARVVDGINHYAFLGWSVDGQWLSVADTTYQLWLVPREAGGATAVGGEGALSPVAPEVAFIDAVGSALHVRALDRSEDRVLESNAQGFTKWASDGSALLDSIGAGMRVVSASNAEVILEGATSLRFGPDAWVARTDTAGHLITQSLQPGAKSGATFSATQPPSLASDQFAWLPNGDVGFIADGALHVAAPDGSGERIAHRDVSALVAPQGSRVP